jgi:hypothetical protein
VWGSRLLYTLTIVPAAQHLGWRQTAITLGPCRYAINNTKRGIETCGILAGVLSANDATFTITTLIVPQQEGTTDTVQVREHA